MTASPCVSICKLDPKTQVCIGCGRTIMEIAAWPQLEERERRAIIERLQRSRQSVASGATS